MEWLELTIDSASEGIGLLEAALTLNGFDSFVIDDEAEFHNFLEPTATTGTLWTRSWKKV